MANIRLKYVKILDASISGTERLPDISARFVRPFATRSATSDEESPFNSDEIS